MQNQIFDAAGPVELDVTNPAGDIEVTATDTHSATVEVRPGSGRDRDEEACRETRIEYDESRRCLLVHAPKNRFGRGVSLQMTITVPSGSRVRARAGSGDLTGSGRFGDLDAGCGSGDVHFGEIGGDARVKTGSGDIELGTVTCSAVVSNGSGDIEVRSVTGELRAQSASGDVRVGEVTGAAVVTSASGDIEVGSVAGDTRLKTASGDIEVGLAAGVNARLDVSTASGRVDSSLPVDDAPPAGGRLIDLSAHTASGDISLSGASRPVQPLG